MEDDNETKVSLPQQGDIHIPLNQSNISISSSNYFINSFQLPKNHNF